MAIAAAWGQGRSPGKRLGGLSTQNQISSASQGLKGPAATARQAVEARELRRGRGIVLRSPTARRIVASCGVLQSLLTGFFEPLTAQLLQKARQELTYNVENLWLARQGSSQ